MKGIIPVFFALGVLFSSCSTNNVDIDNSIGQYFEKNHLTGSFALFNNGTGKFTIYDLDRYRDSAYLPASTFKIVNSLIGLQTGVISSDTMVIPWDGIKRSIPEWNQDLHFMDAFRYSAVPYFQEVARRIGKDTMQFWLDSLSYGTKKITGPIDTFWLDNSLRITADEQLGLVKRLYFYQLPFYRLHQESVKKAMLMEDKPDYKLSYKSGYSPYDPKRNSQIGWMVGYVVENEHPYFFELNVQSKDPNLDLREIRGTMLKDILTHLGFLKGRK